MWRIALLAHVLDFLNPNFCPLFLFVIMLGFGHFCANVCGVGLVLSFSVCFENVEKCEVFASKNLGATGKSQAKLTFFRFVLKLLRNVWFLPQRIWGLLGKVKPN